MNAATRKVLDALKSGGFDVSSLEQQANGNPVLDRVADIEIGGGVLRRQEFTQYKEDKEKEVTSLREQVRTLAANQDNLENFSGNPELHKAALEIIETQRQNLIDAGFDEEAVINLSLKTEESLRAATQKAKELDTKTEKKEEQKAMPAKNEREDVVDLGTLNTFGANLAVGNIVSSVQIARQLRNVEKLGIEVTDELVDKFQRNIVKGIEDGKSYDQITDETFGVSAKRKELADKEFENKLETAKKEAVAEALKDAGVPAHTARAKNHNLYGHLSRQLDESAIPEGAGGTKIINGRKLPVDKFGNVEYYKLRGDKSSRMNHALTMLNELETTKPDLFEEPY